MGEISGAVAFFVFCFLKIVLSACGWMAERERGRESDDYGGGGGGARWHGVVLDLSNLP